MESKYLFEARLRNRLDILNRITTFLIQKGIPVEYLSFKRVEGDMADVEILCVTEDIYSCKRVVNQANQLVDVAQISFRKVN
jgi:acetolactate synthase small subunit